MRHRVKPWEKTKETKVQRMQQRQRNDLVTRILFGEECRWTMMAMLPVDRSVLWFCTSSDRSFAGQTSFSLAQLTQRRWSLQMLTPQAHEVGLSAINRALMRAKRQRRWVELLNRGALGADIAFDGVNWRCDVYRSGKANWE